MFLLALIQSILVTRTLGPELRGSLEILNTVPQLIVNLGTLGIGNANIYFLGKKIYPEEKIISNSIGLVLVHGTILLSIAFAFEQIFRDSFFLGIPQYYVVLAFSVIPLFFFQNLVRYTMLGKQKIYDRNKLILFGGLTNVSLVLCLVLLLKLSLLGILIATIISTLLTSALSFVMLSRIGRISVSFDFRMTLQCIKFGIVPYMALAILNLNYRADVFLIKFFLSDADLGNYALGVSLAEKIWMIPQSIGIILFSRVSNSTDGEANIITPKVCRSVLFISIMAGFVLYLLVPYVLPVLYGKDFTPSISSFRLLLPGIVLMAIFLVLHGDLSGRGKAWYALFIFGGALILNIALNILMIPRLGINGASIASSMSYGFGSLTLAYAFARRNNIKPWDVLLINRKDIQDLYDMVPIRIKDPINRAIRRFKESDT